MWDGFCGEVRLWGESADVLQPIKGLTVALLGRYWEKNKTEEADFERDLVHGKRQEMACGVEVFIWFIKL